MGSDHVAPIASQSNAAARCPRCVAGRAGNVRAHPANAYPPRLHQAHQPLHGAPALPACGALLAARTLLQHPSLPRWLHRSAVRSTPACPAQHSAASSPLASLPPPLPQMIWLSLLPLTLWESCGWAMLPFSLIITFLLLGAAACIAGRLDDTCSQNSWAPACARCRTAQKAQTPLMPACLLARNRRRPAAAAVPLLRPPVQASRRLV